MDRTSAFERAVGAEGDGDALAYEGELNAAKESYGRAIDAYLGARAFADAARTCRKVIRVAPDVARARFTLVFLLIGEEEYERAAAELVAYADAVRAADAGSYAVVHLRLLAHATRDPALRLAIQELIRDLGPPGEEPVTAAEVEPTGWRTRWESLLEHVLLDSAS